MRYLRWGGLTVLLLLVVAAALNEVSKATCFTLTGHAICRVETDQPLVALTFDDGPTALGVDSVLPVLKRYNARGTFFLIGGSFFPPYGSTDDPLVRRIVAEGHEIGNHSLSHKRMVLHSSSFYDREIKQTDAILRAAGAPKPTLFRPPYGKKLFGLPLAVERNGYTM